MLWRWQFSPNWSTDSKQSLTKSQLFGFFSLFCAKIDVLMLKFIWKCKGLRIAKILWAGGGWKTCTFLISEYPQSYINQDWHKDWHMGQWNKIEGTEINPQKKKKKGILTFMVNWFFFFWWIDFWQRWPVHFSRIRLVFSTNSTKKSGYPYAKKWNGILTSHCNIKLKS